MNINVKEAFKRRSPEEYVIVALALMIALYHIYCALFGVKVPMQFRPVHLGFLLPMAFLRKAVPQEDKPCALPIRIVLWIMAVLSFVSCAYISFFSYERYSIRMYLVSPVETLDYVFGFTLIILILTLPILGVALYFLIGLNGGTWKMRMRYKKIDEKLLPLLPENKEVLQCLNASDPKAGNVSNYIERNACYPVYQNTDVIYFDEAVKGLEAQLADLAKAEQFIFMEYHAIEDEYAWSRIQTVLEERVKAGVEVRVFYDDMGSIGFVNLSFARKLEAKGIACRVFNPLLPGLNMFLNNRDHRKITVVDGKVGYTGGYNLANEYFNYTHPYGEWKDTGIRLEGDAVASLTAAFLEMWESSGKTPAGVDVLDIEAQKKYLVQHPYQAQQTGYIQPYADCPLDGIQVGEDVYISIVNKADRYCWFMTPYLIITDEMTHALSLAAKRGVDVRIITPGIPDKKLIYSITRSFYHNLVQDGVRIYEWTPGFCHAKMSVADDCMATCGTINLDYRSLYHHFENGCFMADCDAVLDIRRDMEQTFEQCREVTEKYKSGRSATLRLGQLFLRLFAELL